ncbi:hypothetical protein NC651_003925 [Populus alba x Populus x berolinensis]|nr:hypothetical protein NC651_003925 [Populus alba x Populus x berolinensis]
MRVMDVACRLMIENYSFFLMALCTGKRLRVVL